MKVFKFILICIFIWIFTAMIFGIGYYLSGYELKPGESMGAAYVFSVFVSVAVCIISGAAYFYKKD